MEVTQDLLKDYFTYDGKNLLWKTRRSNAVVGAIAGGINSQGYRRISLFKKQLLAHRLIWFYVHGEWPDGMLDHINRDKLDNRIHNLRTADMALNVRNRGAYPSKTGIKGVYPHGKKFIASIQVGDKCTHLGSYKTVEEAAAARQAGERMAWGTTY